MQAHTQAEFRASIKEGIVMAHRKERNGWLPLTYGSRADHKGDFYVNGSPPKDNNPSRASNGHNFKTETWSRHVVQFHGEKTLALVVVCECSSGDHEARISLVPADKFGDARYRSKTLVRSLGYVGSFLREYGSAARLLQVRGKSSNALLKTVSAPGRQRKEYPATAGSFVPASSVGRLDTSRVSLNAAQREAVMKLTGCLDIIVGPPGERFYYKLSGLGYTCLIPSCLKLSVRTVQANIELRFKDSVERPDSASALDARLES